jgi:hypothetical protein
MDLRPELYSELYREMVRERRERQRIGERSRRAHRAARDRAPRALVARVLLGAAFAVDSGEAWRGLWERMAGSDPAKSNCS